MLQRIQTLYLMTSAICSGVLYFSLPLWNSQVEDAFYASDVTLYTILFLTSAVLSVFSITKFKTRQTQFVLGRLNIILNIILLGLFVYRLLNLSGVSKDAEKGIGLFLPIISIVLLALANKAIKKDEALVKSVDRLR